MRPLVDGRAVHPFRGTAGTARGAGTDRSNEWLGHNVVSTLDERQVSPNAGGGANTEIVRGSLNGPKRSGSDPRRNISRDRKVVLLVAGDVVHRELPHSEGFREKVDQRPGNHG